MTTPTRRWMCRLRRAKHIHGVVRSLGKQVYLPLYRADFHRLNTDAIVCTRAPEIYAPAPHTHTHTP